MSSKPRDRTIIIQELVHELAQLTAEQEAARQSKPQEPSWTGPLLLDVKQTAKQLGICTKQVYDLANTTDFPTVRLNRRIMVNALELQKWVNRQTQGLERNLGV